MSYLEKAWIKKAAAPRSHSPGILILVLNLALPDFSTNQDRLILNRKLHMWGGNEVAYSGQGFASHIMHTVDQNVKSAQPSRWPVISWEHLMSKSNTQNRLPGCTKNGGQNIAG